MTEKIGRNDPCTCGSGKKYKSCCFLTKGPGKRKKLTAKWINQPQPENLLERTFGQAIAAAGERPEGQSNPLEGKKISEQA